MDASTMVRLRWLLTLIVIGAAALALVRWWRTAPASDATTLLPAPGPTLSTTIGPIGPTTVRVPEIGVDVVGAVQHPDLYYLAEGARVADAIKAAGGFAPDADRDAVNLAARLKDEQQLRVPRVGESQSVARDVKPTSAVAIARGEDASSSTMADGLVDLNRADAAALEALPGVGATLAGRIIDYRTTHGPFQSVDQLDDVDGIGAETLAELRSLVTVSP
jgi:competence protein ComEA